VGGKPRSAALGFFSACSEAGCLSNFTVLFAFPFLTKQKVEGGKVVKALRAFSPPPSVSRDFFVHPSCTLGSGAPDWLPSSSGSNGLEGLNGLSPLDLSPSYLTLVSTMA
jgi:hypothetical protein